MITSGRLPIPTSSNSVRTGCARSDCDTRRPIGHLLAEADGATGATQKEYIWLDDLPVATVDDTGASPVIAYIHTDHLGTPQKITDASMNLVWDGVFDPFGNSTSITGSATMNLRFPGQYFDAETGLAQNWNRDYDSSLGRYIESDPIGLDGGVNTYTYVQNEVTVAVDATGLRSLWSCLEKCLSENQILLAVTGASSIGAIPISKRFAGYPVLRGRTRLASGYTNLISAAGQKLFPKALSSQRLLGSSRIFGILGRANLLLDAVLLTASEYELALCLRPCIDKPDCVGGGGGF